MANDVADLLLKLDATTVDLRREITRAENTVAGSSGKMQKMIGQLDKKIDQMGQVAKKAGIAVAGGFAAAGAALTAMTKSGLESVDTLAKTSDKLGVTTEALARLRFAAEQTGVSQKTLDVGLQRFTRRLADAAAGTGPAVKAFDALGLSADELVKLEPDQAFARVADEMNKVENQSQKVSLAFKLFDSEGVGLVNTLALGSDGLAELGAQADAAGLAISRVDASKVEAANDAMNRVSSITSGLSQQLAVQFAPALEGIADRFFAIGTEADASAEIATRVFDAMAKAAGVFGDAIVTLQLGWEGMQLVFQHVYKFMVGGLDNLAQAGIRAYNMLPWVDDVEVSSMFGGFLATMEAQIAESQRNVDNLLSRPLPSTAIEQWVAETREATDVGAIEIIDAHTGMQDAIITTEQVTESLATKTQEKTKEVQSAWDKALQDTAARIDESFAQAWRGAFDSFDDFSRSLVDAFKNLLAEMAHLAITRPIIMNIGASMGIGGAAAGAASTGFSLAGAGSSLASSFTGFGAGAYNLLADGAYAIGLDTLGLNARASAGLGFGGQAMNLGAGIAGSLIGNELFGETSGIGSTLGGFVGSAFGPLGALAGSVLGSGIESLFGGGRPDHNVTGVRFASNDWANGNWRAGEARIFDSGSAETDAAALEIAETLEQMRLLLGGSNQDIVYNVGDQGGLYLAPGRGEGAGSGPNFNGHTFQYGDDIEGFLNHAFDQMIAGATGLSEALRTLLLDFNGTTEQTMQMAAAVMQLDDQIKQNPVTVAIEEFAEAQQSASSRLWDSYQQQLRAVRTLAINFDGSAASAVEMSDALRVSQEMAYRMSVALLDVSNQIDVMFQNSAEQIRESVMTEDQRIAKWRSERDTLQAGLENISDPEALLEAADEINRLNLQIFQSLEDASAETAEQFATFADETNRIAQERIETILGELEQSQAGQMNLIGDTLQQAADQQQTAAQVIADASRVFQESADSFRVNWGSMNASLNGMAENMQQVAISTRQQAQLLDDVIQGNKLQTETAA